jgi:hypothetical protein
MRTESPGQTQVPVPGNPVVDHSPYHGSKQS